MNYHDQLIQVFLQNREYFSALIDFDNPRIQSEVPIGNGDIDILLTNSNQRSVIEVKGHVGLVPHYERVQLPKYQRRFPDARQFVLFGTQDKSVDFWRLSVWEYTCGEELPRRSEVMWPTN